MARIAIDPSSIWLQVPQSPRLGSQCFRTHLPFPVRYIFPFPSVSPIFKASPLFSIKLFHGFRHFLRLCEPFPLKTRPPYLLKPLRHHSQTPFDLRRKYQTLASCKIGNFNAARSAVERSFMLANRVLCLGELNRVGKVLVYVRQHRIFRGLKENRSTPTRPFYSRSPDTGIK